MICTVIVALAALQQTAEQNRAGNEQQVGAGDNKKNRDKKSKQRIQRIGNTDGNKIGYAQQQESEEPQQPVCLGRFFTGIFAAKQGDGIGKMNLPKRIQKGKKIDHPEDKKRLQDGRRRQRQRERGGLLQ